MIYRKTETCSVCGAPMWGGPDLATVPCCLNCRRTLPRELKLEFGVVKPRARNRRLRSRIYPATCEQCGGAFIGRTAGVRFCSLACFGTSIRIRPDDDRRVQRARRDLEAAGMTQHQRSKLLKRWKARGSSCAYCAGPCETVDHVVPLVRGGTNFEGNLAPCCKACNSSKGARLVVEWRAGLPAGKTFVVVPLQLRRIRRRGRRLVMLTERTCTVCGRLFSSARRRHCSEACMLEHHRRLCRDRHRRMVGLSMTGGSTSKWVAPQSKRRAGSRRRPKPVADNQLRLVG